MVYDVFLSHNSQDKPDVRAVAEWLRRNGVPNPWLDEVALEPGDRLPDRLGEAMENSRAALVFIGPHGEGGWQNEEIDSLLNKAIRLSRQKDEFRIIPVLLPNADTSKLRWFLRTRLWVDLSKGVTDSQAELYRLQQAILGKVGAPPVADGPDFNPYKGLAAFQARDAAFFFGRVNACRELATKLRDLRFASIGGPSGNGKSSLARAGLATEAAAAVCPDIRTWKRVTLFPGSNLTRAFLEQLAAGREAHERPKAVAEAMERVDPADRVKSAEEWADALDAEFRAWAPEAETPVLFLVDQLEEIFTHRGLRAVTEEQREARIRRILDGLALLVSKGDKRWRFVFTLRDDFRQRCRMSPTFWDLVLTKGELKLDELDEEGWREAIKGPAARAGAYLEAGLVDTMLKDVYRQRGSMPLLQLALYQLWQGRKGSACLSHDAYIELGGVANALQNRASRALGLLKEEKPEYGEIARNLLLRLTSLGEGVADTRRRVPRAELDWEGIEFADIEHVLTRFSDADHRLIVTNADEVEVTHEVLIRESEDIREWLDGAGGVRPDILILRRVTHAATRWQARDRDRAVLNLPDSSDELERFVAKTTLRLTKLERLFIQNLCADREHQLREARRRARRFQLIATLATGLAAAALVAGGVAFKLKQKADKAAAMADAAAKREKKAAASAAQAATDAQSALATSFYRSIGTSTTRQDSSGVLRYFDPFEFSFDEREALWELATLKPENQAIRRMLLDRWRGSSNGISRAMAGGGRGLLAAAGLWVSPETVEPLTRSWIEGNTANYNISWLLGDLVSRMEIGERRKLARQVVTSEVSKEKKLVFLKSSVPILVALAGSMDAGMRAGLTGWIVSAIEDEPEERQNSNLEVSGRILRALAQNEAWTGDMPGLGNTLLRILLESGEGDPGQLAFATRVIGEQARSLDTTMRAEWIDRVATALEEPEVDPDRLEALGTVLVSVTAQAEDQLRSQVIWRMVAELAKPATTADVRIHVFGKLLIKLAAQMSPGSQAELARQVFMALEDPEEKNPYRLVALGELLAALSASMDSASRTKLVEHAATATKAAILAKALEEVEGERLRFVILRAGLADLSPLMETEPWLKLANLMTTKLEEDFVLRLRALSKVSVPMKDGPRTELVEWGIAILESESDSAALSAVGKMLVALIDSMAGGHRAQMAEQLAMMLEREQAPAAISALSSVLIATAGSMESERQVSIVAERFAMALENPEETFFLRLNGLAEVLNALAGRMTDEPCEQLARKMVTRLKNPAEIDSGRLAVLGRVFVASVKSLKAQRRNDLVSEVVLALENEPSETKTYRARDLGLILAALAENGDLAEVSGFRGALLTSFLQSEAEMDDEQLEAMRKAVEKQTLSLDASMREQWIGRIVEALQNENDPRWVNALSRVLAALGPMEAKRVIPLAVGITQNLEGLGDSIPQLRLAWAHALDVMAMSIYAAEKETQRIRPADSLGTASKSKSDMLLETRLLVVSVFMELDFRMANRSIEKNDFRDAVGALDQLQLIEVLKWPFCVGDVQRIVLEALERPQPDGFGCKLDRGLASVIDQSLALGISPDVLRRPPVRPSAQAALAELQAVAVKLGL